MKGKNNLIECTDCEWDYPFPSIEDCKRYNCNMYGSRPVHDIKAAIKYLKYND